MAGQTGWRLPTEQELGSLWTDKGSAFLAAQGWPLDWTWSLNPFSSGHIVRRMSDGARSWATSASTDVELVTCVHGTGEFPTTISNAGLTWMRPEATARMYAAAETYCSSTAIAGHTGWRLPTQAELQALHTAKGSNFLANAGWTLDWVWTSTPFSSGHVVVRDAGATSWGDSTGPQFMTCVYP
jgi:hypothetical protein